MRRTLGSRIMLFRKDDATVTGYVNVDRDVRKADTSEGKLEHLEFRGKIAEGMTGRELKAAKKQIAKENDGD